MSNQTKKNKPTYESIYYFNVLDKIQEGNEVRYLDKKTLDCGVMNRERVEYLSAVLTICRVKSDRFEFWIDHETEEAEDEE